MQKILKKLDHLRASPPMENGNRNFQKIFPGFFRNASLVSIRECKEKKLSPPQKGGTQHDHNKNPSKERM